MKIISKTLLFAAWFFFLCADPVSAHRLDHEEDYTPAYYRERTLGGDWAGLRTRAHSTGFDLELEYFGDFQGNVTGGNGRRADATQYLESELLVDAHRWLGWKGARFFFLVYGVASTDPSVRINTRQTVSSIEAADTIKLFEAWWEQDLWRGLFSVRAGLYSLDTEFDFKPTANLFINGAFGTGVDLSEVSVTGPAIYPFSALGVRLKGQVSGFYLMAAAVDGVPGDPDNPHGTQVVLDRDDGFLIALETGFQNEAVRTDRLKLGFGAWLYTRRMPDLANPALTRRGRYSLYGFIDLRLFSETTTGAQGLDAFLRAGVADNEAARFKRHLAAGLAYTGLLPGRDADVLGFAVSTAWAGDSLRTAQAAAGQGTEEEEIVLELTYAWSPQPWASVQPHAQYFIHPGLNPNLSDTLYLGLRLEITL